MSTCNILGHGIIHDTYEDQGWFDLCGWQTPDITYDAFVTGITETYNNNTSLKNRVFSDYVTRLYKECLLDTFVSGGTLNAATGVVTFTNTTGGTLDVSGFDGFTSYWSASTGGISTSGTGSVTASGGFVGNLTGTADVASVATTVTLTDESSDTTCFPVFAQTATGNIALETGTNLTFNSATGVLGCGTLKAAVLEIVGEENPVKITGLATTEENYLTINSDGIVSISSNVSNVVDGGTF